MYKVLFEKSYITTLVIAMLGRRPFFPEVEPRVANQDRLAWCGSEHATQMTR